MSLTLSHPSPSASPASLTLTAPALYSLPTSTSTLLTSTPFRSKKRDSTCLLPTSSSAASTSTFPHPLTPAAEADTADSSSDRRCKRHKSLTHSQLPASAASVSLSRKRVLGLSDSHPTAYGLNEDDPALPSRKRLRSVLSGVLHPTLSALFSRTRGSHRLEGDTESDSEDESERESDPSASSTLADCLSASSSSSSSSSSATTCPPPPPPPSPVQTPHHKCIHSLLSAKDRHCALFRCAPHHPHAHTHNSCLHNCDASSCSASAAPASTASVTAGGAAAPALSPSSLSADEKRDRNVHCYAQHSPHSSALSAWQPMDCVDPFCKEEDSTAPCSMCDEELGLSHIPAAPPSTALLPSSFQARFASSAAATLLHPTAVVREWQPPLSNIPLITPSPPPPLRLPPQPPVWVATYQPIPIPLSSLPASMSAPPSRRL